MPQVINTNVASLMVQRNLNSSQAEAATAMNRLSSGLRINSAKDDAAGLSIASRFTSQINGMNQAIRNAGDAVSLTATAESALGEISDNLQRVRELAVQASNSTYNADDRAALQTEASQLIAEIDRVANATNFNNISLLDGTFTAQIFQVGADAGDNITIASLTDANTATLGTGTLSSAQVSVAKSTITDLGAQVTGILDINGTDVGAFAAAQSVDERVGQIIAAVNAVEDTTGVSAYDDGTNLVLVSTTDGTNINLAASTGAVTDIGFDETAVIGSGSAAAGLAATTTGGIAAASVSSYAGAQRTLALVDDALTTVNSARADIGAMQSRFESAVSSLQVAVESASSSRSRIMDADFAAETAAMTKNQILQQAGISVLSQANAQPQNVLALLQ
jgi:flagellin